jgi:serine/threonine protein kinase
MPIAAVVDLIESLRQSKLLEAHQLDEVTALQARFADPRELARHLIQKGWITPYQMNQLFQGKGSELILGQYVLLERLGEGGMGQVFKARHQRLDRIVALKVIRKEKLDNPTAVRRFQREIKAAAQLTHPNIVMAFDADQAGQTHFFAMEFVDGIDLNRMVKDGGPLPVAQVCDYMRQAALGLQHACERGLVHRDIKPANLLVERVENSSGSDTISMSPSAQYPHGRIKILDMGLARAGKADENDVVSRLTQEGTVMGTPDFIAPEQAMNSSTADIRADLYSLGCSFYFLLTGKVVFPGGTLMEKLIKHRSDPPPPIEQLRPDVPPKVANIVRKLLEKKAEDRYQTPAELAQAIDAAVHAGVPGGKPTLAEPGTGGAVPTSAPASRRRLWTFVAVGGAVGLLGFALLSCVILSVLARKGGNNKDNKAGPGPIQASILDKLDPARVKREPGLPSEAVAVLGKEGDKLFTVAFGGDGKWLALGGQDNQAVVWDMVNLEQHPLAPKHDGAVNVLAFRPKSAMLASGSHDGRVRTWDLSRNFNNLGRWDADRFEVDALAFAPDGRGLATAGADRGIRLWVFEGGKLAPAPKLDGHDGPVLSLAYDPSGKFLASGGRDKGIRLWDATGKRTTAMETWNEHLGEVLALAYSPDGSVLASGGKDNTVVLGRMDGRERRESTRLLQHTDAVTSLAFSADGTALFSAGLDGTLVQWDVASKRMTRTWSLPPPVRAINMAPDGRHLAVTTGTGKVVVMRLNFGK